MILRCVSNLAADLPAAYINEAHGYGRDTDFPLTIGREYIPLGLTTYVGGMWAFVLDDDSLFYPVWKPMPLFEIVDGTISPTWRVGHRGEGERYQLVISFPEWASDSNFYERLTDGLEDYRATFEHYCVILEAEHSFRRPTEN